LPARRLSPSSRNRHDRTHEHGKLSIAAAPDGVHNTIAWSGFAINEVQSTDVTYTVTDSAGTTVTSTYTGIVVQRTS
jgi:hypothetical protein